MRPTRRTIIAAALALACALAVAPPQVRAATPTLAQIKARGTLKVGVKYDAPPFGSLNLRTGQVEGFEVDLARAVAGKLLGDPKKVEFVQVKSDNRIPLLQNGDIDLFIATATITPDRLKEIEFSDVYFRSGQSLLVRKGSPVKSYHDLAGKAVCTVTGTTPEQTIRKVAPAANVQTFETYPDCFQALLGGRVDAMTTDDGILLGYQRQAPDRTEIVGGTFTFEPYGIGIAKGDPALLRAVNAALVQLGNDGTYARLYRADLGRPLPGDFKSWYAMAAQTAAQRFVAQNPAK